MGSTNITLPESSRFHYHRLRHELGNYSLLKSRHCDGAIISMHQSGTHWLKFMLASAMAAHYGIPEPEYNHANDIIGGTKDPRRYADLPFLKSSHTIAPILLRNTHVVRRAALPPYVVLVRDIRACLVSNYKKWRARYAVSFSEYLRGDPAGRRFNSDIWWCIRFVNAWGRMSTLSGDRLIVVRYEDLRTAPRAQLERIVRHFGLPLSVASIGHGVEAATKTAMAERSDPARPPGEVNFAEDDPLVAFSNVDRDFVRTRCAHYLRCTFGYDYAVWSAAVRNCS